MYIVRTLKECMNIDVMGLKRPLEMRWASGMIGAMPVFSDYESAVNYADGDENLIIKVEFEGVTK